MKHILSMQLPTSGVTTTVGALTISGSVLLLALVYDWVTLGLGAAALIMQSIAICLVVMNRLWERSRRLLIYPILVFCTVYVWDTRLPPPNLPDGPLRAWIPLVLIGALLIDTAYLSQKSRPTNAKQVKGISVIGGYVDVDEAAAFFGMRSTELRTLLQQTHETPIVAFNGREYVIWPALMQVLAVKNRHSELQ